MRRVALSAALCLVAWLPLAPPAGADTFANPETIAVPGPQGTFETAGEPYPSGITVSGLTGTVTDVNVTLCGLSATYPSDLDIVLVAPNGTNALIMSDVGGNGNDAPPADPQGDVPVSNATITLDDAAPAPLPADTPLTAGTYRPFDDNTHDFEIAGVDADIVLPPAFPNPRPNPADRLGVFRPSTGVWFFRSDSNNVELSAFNGGEPNGAWKLYVNDDVASSVEDGEVQPPKLACGWSLDITAGGTGVPYGNGTVVQFGAPGDIPVQGDYDGNGSLEIAVYRPSTGFWFVLGGETFQFGTAGDIPVPADYDADGDTDAAVYRPSTGFWFVRNGPATQFGAEGDIPVPADYDNDDDADIAVFRPSNGLWLVNGPLIDPNVPTVLQWGADGDVPVPGDYNRDGKDDVGVFRPAEGLWLIRPGSFFPFGTATDIPVPYDATNDAIVDVVVFRPSTGVWFIQGSPAVPFGTAGDIPVPLSPVTQALFFP